VIAHRDRSAERRIRISRAPLHSMLIRRASGDFPERVESQFGHEGPQPPRDPAVQPPPLSPHQKRNPKNSKYPLLIDDCEGLTHRLETCE
jgi:hypothetical protein